MYWPSACVDSDYVFRCKDAPLASVAFLLGTYTDWRNMVEWPQVPGAAPNYQKMALKQGDPLTKPGIVGAFCRAYDIRTAMDKFLPGVYTPCIMGSEGGTPIRAAARRAALSSTITANSCTAIMPPTPALCSL